MSENADISIPTKPKLQSPKENKYIHDPRVAHELADSTNNLIKNKFDSTEIGSGKMSRFAQRQATSLAIAQAEETVKSNDEKLIDGLTGLPGAKAFEQEVYADLKKLGTGEINAMGVVWMDLDYFSWVNEYIGAHHLGDLYLKETAKVLDDHIRKTDDLVFRPSGDEFSAVFKDSFSSEKFDEIAKRLHGSVNKKILEKTLNRLSSDRRQMKYSGKMENEATVTIKQFLQGLVRMKHDVPHLMSEVGARTDFIQRAKGPKDKERFLQAIDAIKEDSFKEYLLDDRVDSELSQGEKDSRAQKEKELIQVIVNLFPNLTVSMGGVYIDKTKVTDFEDIKRQSEGLVKSVKSMGGGGCATKVIEVN